MSHVHLFTADVPRHYLERFITPKLVISADKLFIRHFLLPYEPKATLKSRIFHLITAGDEQELADGAEFG
jgi:hypothetical protein